MSVPVVGVLGGTFDPVHSGHLEIASRARAALELDRMLLLPTARPPHKRLASLSPVEHRAAMLGLALAGRDDLELCPLELAPDRVSFTYDTMRQLRDGRPGCLPVFVLGLDALREIETWHEWRRLLAEFDLAAIVRPDGLGRARPLLRPEVAGRLVVPAPGRPLIGAFRALRPGRGGRVLLLPFEPIAISSTLVRARAAMGQSLDELVPPAVARYIQRTGLYREEDAR